MTPSRPRTGFASPARLAPPLGEARRAVAVTVAGRTQIFPTYADLRNAVLAEHEPVHAGQLARAEARGLARGRREATWATALAFAAGPLLLLVLAAVLP